MVTINVFVYCEVLICPLQVYSTPPVLISQLAAAQIERKVICYCLSLENNLSTFQLDVSVVIRTKMRTNAANYSHALLHGPYIRCFVSL